MEVSPNLKVASLLPRLRHWVPGLDFVQVVVVIVNAPTDVDDIVDQRCSKRLPW